MNKEQQELLDEAYMSCMSKNGFKYENGLLVGKMGGLNYDVTYWLTKEEFINKCKTDTEFSERWGLKIEERELSFNSRYRVGKYQPYNIEGKVEYENRLDYITKSQFENFHNKEMDKLNIPTKLIIVTYKDKTIESYE